MKYIMKVKIPTKDGNARIKGGDFGHSMQKLLQEVNAEAAYFGTTDGCRTGFIIVNSDDASQMVKIAEPFFLYLNAEIDWLPVMTPQDLGKASPYLEDAVKNWG